MAVRDNRHESFSLTTRIRAIRSVECSSRFAAYSHLIRAFSTRSPRIAADFLLLLDWNGQCASLDPVPELCGYWRTEVVRTGESRSNFSV